MASKCKWTVVAVTCSPHLNSDALYKELLSRQSKGYINEDAILMVVNDPIDGIGSGGATLNALLVITELLAAKEGFTIVNSDVLDKAKILILHIGRFYAYNSTGRAFLSIPDERGEGQHDEMITSLDLLIRQISSQFAHTGPPGVWVCSTDMHLSVPSTFVMNWSDHKEADVLTFSVKGSISDAKNHGIYISNEQGRVESIIYQCKDDILLHGFEGGQVDVVAGIVYFNKRASEKLLSFHTLSPLNSCTYFGVDSGARPINVSLFFDLIYAMCNSRPYENPPTIKMPAEQYQVKWRLLHKILSNLNVKKVDIENGQYRYLFNTKEALDKVLRPLQEAGKSATIINSVVAPAIPVPSSCLILNSLLTGSVTLAEDVYMSGVDLSLYQLDKPLTFQSGVIYQHLRVRLNNSDEVSIIPVIFGCKDALEKPSSNGTFCNQLWLNFYERTGIKPEELWAPNVVGEQRSLLTAKLYPVMEVGSFAYPSSLLWMQEGQAVPPEKITRWRNAWRMSLVDLLQLVDFPSELGWRRKLFTDAVKSKVKDTIVNKLESNLLTLYKLVCADQPENAYAILDILDKVAWESTSPGIAARALANIADVLGCMAGAQGGIRSGPSANQQWAKAFHLLEKGEIQAGVTLLAEVRGKWMSRSDQLIRAARHYEGAAQILIRLAVMTARNFINLTPTDNMPAMDQWIIGESPARADIAGGWSDTPPISYEHGGAVTNVAILVDGKRPIGCKARRIREPHLVFVMSSGSESTKLVINDLDDLKDYYQPQSPGCLLKAAFVCTEIIDIKSSSPLNVQLASRYQGGFELQTWSDLPHGSGLGTSSILAGVVMAVLWTVSGKQYNMSSLVHAVLHVEQMMTTGGGWQDQIGGLLPGFKIGTSKAELPLYVEYTLLDISPETLKAFNDRFLLIYTGKTRLARNLLQNVIRNWYARDPSIVNTENELVKIAHEASKALCSGDLVALGRIWSYYWDLKKQMATGCEPASVARMITALAPYVHGCCMAGAGGGGFLYVLTKDSNQEETVARILSELKLNEAYSIHKGMVCMDGLTTRLHVYTDEN